MTKITGNFKAIKQVNIELESSRSVNQNKLFLVQLNCGTYLVLTSKDQLSQATP